MSTRSLAVLLVAALMVVLTAGCSKRISGKYVHKEQNVFGGTSDMSLEFKKDGTYIDGTIGLVGTYEIEGNQITLYQEVLGSKTAQKGTLEKGAIVMPGLMGSQQMRYERAK